MKKQYKWIIVLGSVAVLLFAVFLVVDTIAKRREKEIEETIGPRHLFNFDSEETRKIAVNGREGDFCFEWDSDASTWKLTSEEKFTINTYTISAICNYFHNLWTLKTVKTDCQDLAPYGLDNPTTLHVYTKQTGEENPYVLHVGNLTPTGDSYYVKTDDSNNVYTIDYNSGSIFTLTKDSLKNHYMFDVMSPAITYYQLERDGKVIMELNRDEKYAWKLKVPVGFELDNSLVDTLMTTLVHAEYTSFPEENPKDLAKYGLDKPKAKLKLKGTRNDLPIESELWFGNPISDKETETDIYGYEALTGQVFTIHKGDVYYIEENPEDFILPYAVSMKIENVKQIHVDLGELYDMNCILDVQYKDSKAFFQLRGEKSSDESTDLQTLYGNFYRGITTIPFSELDLDAVPQGNPAATITYTMNDGSEQILAFVPKSDNSFYAIVNGRYTGMTFRLNRLTGGTGITKYYEALMQGLKG